MRRDYLKIDFDKRLLILYREDYLVDEISEPTKYKDSQITLAYLTSTFVNWNEEHKNKLNNELKNKIQIITTTVSDMLIANYNNNIHVCFNNLVGSFKIVIKDYHCIDGYYDNETFYYLKLKEILEKLSDLDPKKFDINTNDQKKMNKRFKNW